MRYQVPQFIEVEDKIFGPFTFKQFSFLVGGVGACFIIYKFLPFFIGLPFMLVAMGISSSLAFYKVNNRPLIDTLEAAFKYIFTKRLYTWQKRDKVPEKSISEDLLSDKSKLYVPKVSESKLKDLAWSLDINETIYSKDSGKLESREALSNFQNIIKQNLGNKYKPE